VSLSASSVERAMLCAAAAALPSIDRPSAAAKRGSEEHERIQANIPKQLLELLGDHVQVELALSLDVLADSARVIGTKVGRQYGELRASEIPMSLDLVGSLGIVEIKTGRLRSPPPETNWQIRTQALGLARVRKLPTVKAHLATKVGSAFEIDSHEFTAWEIDCVSDDLSALHARISGVKAQLDRGERPDVNPSETACRWCNCRAACPAFADETDLIGEVRP